MSRPLTPEQRQAAWGVRAGIGTPAARAEAARELRAHTAAKAAQGITPPWLRVSAHAANAAHDLLPADGSAAPFADLAELAGHPVTLSEALAVLIVQRRARYDAGTDSYARTEDAQKGQA